MPRPIDPSMIEGIEPVQQTSMQRGAPSPFVPLVNLAAYQRRGPRVIDPSMIESVHENVSDTASFFRGLGQMATFGFADEISGGLESLFSAKTYEEARDESRANFDAAQAANPGAYLAGEIGGGIGTAFVPGLGVAGAAKGIGTLAKLARLAGRGAAEGGIAGAGFSTGNNASEISRDIAIGAGAGVAGAGLFGGAQAGLRKSLAKLAKGAPKRVKDRIISEITQTTNPKARNQLLGERGKNSDRIASMILNDDELFATHRDPTSFFDTIKKKIDDLGDPLDQMYARTDNLSSGLDGKEVLDVIDGFVGKSRKAFRGNIAKAFEKTGKNIRDELFPRTDVAAKEVKSVIQDVVADVVKNETKIVGKAIRRQMDELGDMVSSFGSRDIAPGELDRLVSGIMRKAKYPEGINVRVGDALNDVAMRATQKSSGKISATQMRQLVRGLQEDAFTGSIIDPTPVKRAMRELTDDLRQKLNNHVEDVLDRAGEKVGWNGREANIRELNQRMSDLINLSRVAERSATRQGGRSGAGKTIASTGFAGNTLRNLGVNISDPTTATALAALDPTGLGQANLAFQVGKRGASALDTVLARGGADAALPGVERTTAGVRRALTGQAAEAGARGSAAKRSRMGLTELAAMARGGARVDDIALRASELGVDPKKAAEVVELFGPG